MQFQQKGRLIVFIMNMSFLHNTTYAIPVDFCKPCDIFSQ